MPFPMSSPLHDSTDKVTFPDAEERRQREEAAKTSEAETVAIRCCEAGVVKGFARIEDGRYQFYKATINGSELDNFAKSGFRVQSIVPVIHDILLRKNEQPTLLISIKKELEGGKDWDTRATKRGRRKSGELSNLREGEVGEKDGKRFIVVDRCPEDRSSGLSTIQFEDGGRKRFVWDYSNPRVKKIGTGKLVTKIILDSDVDVEKRERLLELIQQCQFHLEDNKLCKECPFATTCSKM